MVLQLSLGQLLPTCPHLSPLSNVEAKGDAGGEGKKCQWGRRGLGGDSFQVLVTETVLVLGGLVVLGERFKGAWEERAGRTLFQGRVVCEGVSFGLWLHRRGIVQRRPVLSNISSLLFLPPFLTPFLLARKVRTAKRGERTRGYHMALLNPLQKKGCQEKLGGILLSREREVGGWAGRRRAAKPQPFLPFSLKVFSFLTKHCWVWE